MVVVVVVVVLVVVAVVVVMEEMVLLVVAAAVGLLFAAEIAPPDPIDVLPRDKCEEALRAARQARWFEVRC